MRCLVMLYLHMFKFLLHITCVRALLYLHVFKFLIIHIVYDVAYTLLTCVYIFTHCARCHVFFTYMCLRLHSIVMLTPSCIVTLPARFALSRTFNCIVMHVVNNIVPVKFSSSFRHDIVCMVHLKLVQPDESHRYCILRVRRLEN